VFRQELEPPLSSDAIDYQRFVEDALRDAVRRLLAGVAEQGLPGEHYFYIGFQTGHPGVAMPRSLRDLYPEEMTIILQHQFWNLEVLPDAFSVELNFSASRQRLTIPYLALTMFADPSAEFALRFTPRTTDQPSSPGEVSQAQLRGGAPAPDERGKRSRPAPAAGREGAGDVIRFDPSRRK
jgi:hypothetical protein